MSSDVQGPLLVMGMLPNTARLSLWPISCHLSLGTGQLPHLRMKHVTSGKRCNQWLQWEWGICMVVYEYSTYSGRSLNIFLRLPMPSLFPPLPSPPLLITMNWEASFPKKLYPLGTIRAWHQRNNILFCPLSSCGRDTEWSEMKMLAALVFPSWCTTAAP